MDGPFPLQSPAHWGATWLGLLLLGGVPGGVAIGWHLRRRGWWTAAVASGAAGVLLAPLAARGLDLLGIGVTWASYGVAALGIAAVLHRVLRDAGSTPPSAVKLERRETAGLGLVCLILALLLITSLRDFVVPPTVHDAGNHALLTARIAEVGSVAPDRIFTDDTGRPISPYLPTWHALAAMAATLTGSPPWIVAWILVLTCLITLPAALGLLWRQWGITGGGLIAGAALLLANEATPVGLLGWGGFSTLVAYAVLPLAVVAVRWFAVQPRAASALAMGLAVGSLGLTSAGAAAVALVTGLVWPGGRRRPGAAAVVVLLATLAAVGGATAWRAGPHYVDHLMSTEDPVRLDRAINSLLNALGRWGPLKLALVAGLWVGLRSRWRWLAVLSLAFGLLYLTLSTLADPLSRLLSTPFYQETGRVRAVQMIFLPALAGLAVSTAAGWVGRRRPPLHVPMLLGILLFLVGPGLDRVHRALRDSRQDSALGPEGYALAAQMPEVVPASARVANHWADGSVWAMHVSGRSFVVPCGWPLTWDGPDRRVAVAGLVQDPWPDLTRHLQRFGVEYLWVDDALPRHVPPSPFRTRELDADPRFEPVLRGGSTALYRIRWEEES